MSSGDLDEVIGATQANLQCYAKGPAVMIRVDSDLPTWWNAALNRLLTSRLYEDICQDLTEAHGKVMSVE